MLKVPVHQPSNTDELANTRQARYNATYAPDHKVYGNPRLACFVKEAYKMRFFKIIYFNANQGRFVPGCFFYLAVNQFFQSVVQIETRYQQFVEF